MEPEQILIQFMRRHYSDERLLWLLAHAESGKLAYLSCCCFIGIATADHALVAGGNFADWHSDHLAEARMLEGGFAAESAYLMLAIDELEKSDPYHEALRRGDGNAAERVADELRRAKLIPLIKAEMARRSESSRSQTEEVSEMVMAV